MPSPRSTAPGPTRIVLPSPPGAREPHPFPVVATIAPVVVSLAMWAVTRSPFALMFAAFGPVMAIAGYVDAGIGGRRRRRRAMRRFATQQEETVSAVARALEEERGRRWAEHPAASSIVAAGRTDVRWRAAASSASLVSIGAGRGASGLAIEGWGGDDAAGDSDGGAAVLALRREAALIDDVPVLIDARHGIGIVGPPALGRAVARALVVQLAHAAGPDALRVVSLPEAGWDAFAELPHLGGRGAAAAPTAGASRPSTLSVQERTAAAAEVSGDDPVPADLRIVVASSVAELPATCTEIVECRSPLRVVWRRADGPERVDALPEPVSAPDAAHFAASMASDALSLGLLRGRREPPVSLRFDELPGPEVGAGAALAVPVGATADGPFVVDLVRDGPHAVIGGTTGSGKSELLITWVTSLAAATTPESLSLLLFDFKGGATFGDVVDLPHVVGLVTDLDEATADRALASLRAELRQRERLLQEAGVRDVRDAPPGVLARLVIVVDEFAAMIESFPELHGVFVDLAARGRSLGVHLVLCTQRPAAAVRDGVLANCDIRISLRVNNAGDSVAVVGTPDAATLPSDRPGRVVAALGGRPAEHAQVATTTTEDIAAVRRSSDGSAARRPWLDPLPAILPLDAIEPVAGGFVLGRLDRPAEQSQPTAVYRPEVDGHLLVLGSAGRGSSTLLAALGAQRPSGWSVLRVPAHPEAAWDAVAEVAMRARGGVPDAGSGSGSGSDASGKRLLVLVDDLDLLMSRWGEEYGRAARAELVDALRSGPAAGIHLVIGAHRVTSDVLALSDLVGSTVRLGSTSKHEHVLSGSDSSSHRPHRRPGSGVWRGSELQIAWVDDSVRIGGPADPTAEPVRIGQGLTMIVSRRPAERAQWVRERHGAEVILLGAVGQGTLRIDDVADASRSTVVVGDVDAWQQQWALLTALRTSATVVVEDASVAEFRSLTRQAALPPWIGGASGRSWLVRPGAPVVRARFATAPDESTSVSRRRRSRRGADASDAGVRS